MTPITAPHHIVAVTPDSLIRGLEETVALHGESRRSVALCSTDTDDRFEIPTTPGLNGIVGQALVTLGVSAQTLSTLGDFLVEGDFNISPMGPFHLTHGSRELAILIDDLDSLGWAWGDILNHVLHGESPHDFGTFDCD